MTKIAMKTTTPIPRNLGARGCHVDPPRSKRVSRLHYNEDTKWEPGECDVEEDDDEVFSDDDPEWEQKKVRKPKRTTSRAKVDSHGASSNRKRKIPCGSNSHLDRLQHLNSECETTSTASSSDGSTNAGERQLMRPWLIDQVENGNTEGLEWMDENKVMLKIPWVHGSSQKWNIIESELFTNWAKHSGRYCEGTPNDPKRWKANFRCALNSLPDVKEVKHLSVKKGANAYKVYKFYPAQVRRSEVKKEAREKLKSGKVSKHRTSSRATKAASSLEKLKLATNDESSSTNAAQVIPMKTRILPDPLEFGPKIHIENHCLFPGVDNSLPDTPPVSPDHSYAQSSPPPLLCTDSAFPDDTVIPTVVEHISREEQVKTTSPLLPFRLGSGPTAFERVCPRYNLNWQGSKSTNDSPSSSSEADSAFSDMSDSGSPMSDITDEEIREIISEMETYEDPAALFKHIQASQEEHDSDSAVETQLIDAYTPLNPNLILQPTAIIEERIQNECMTYTNMGTESYHSFSLTKPMVAASIC